MLRKPWNLPSYAVYSLITYNEEETINMNIMTYVIPVSMHPKRYIIALYHHTQSLENWNLKQKGILQILSPDHTSLVRVLGKKSGKSYNKARYLKKKGFIDATGKLMNIAGYMELKEISKIPSHSGDHELFLCEVIASKSYHNDILMTQELIQSKIIL